MGHAKKKVQKPPKPNKKKQLAKRLKQAPPLFLYQTASPHVYIASIAIDASISNEDKEDDDNDEDESNENEHQHGSPAIHPNSLFTEQINPPQTFLHSSFEYISPKTFNHELPKDASVPEIAFLGRSNVGKSSLLNAITSPVQVKNSDGDSKGNSKGSSKHGRSTHELARVSKTPGRTQQVNYFGQFLNNDDNKGIGGTSFGVNKNSHDGRKKDRNLTSTPPLGYIIDLPGYGYAKAPGDLVNQWQKNTQDFITARREIGALQRIYILIDARRGITVFDSTIMSWLDEATINYTVVLTKCDSVSKPMLVKGANEICMRYHKQVHDDEENGEVVGYQGPFVHVTSSRKGIGIIDLMYAVESDFYVGREIASRDTGGGKGWGK